MCGYCMYMVCLMISNSASYLRFFFLVSQAKVEQQKLHGRGNFNSPRKPSNMHHHRTGPKHCPNVVPPFPVPSPYHQPAIKPVFPTMVPMPHISGPGYGYHFHPGPFPIPDTQLVKSNSNTQVQCFAPPVNGGFKPSSRSDSKDHDAKSGGRRPSAQEQGGWLNPSWPNQRPVVYSNNFHSQQSLGRRPLLKPPFVDQAGFIDGPYFPGNYISQYEAIFINDIKYFLY